MAKQNYKTLELPAKYIPKKSEEYMCTEHLAYFYQILNTQKEELTHERDAVLSGVRAADKIETNGVPDESDSASLEQEITMNLRMSDRDNKLLLKITGALQRLENGTFGYSIESGDEIGLPRMLARPLATLTIEEQEEYEQRKN